MWKHWDLFNTRPGTTVVCEDKYGKCKNSFFLLFLQYQYNDISKGKCNKKHAVNSVIILQCYR